MPSDWQTRLLSWYRRNRRDLPWRRTHDPYAIWVSEVMLQQTQVSTVEPYYLRWMSRFPNVATLATARDEEVLSIWQGLGYYRRVRQLLEGARWVMAQGFPQSAADWRRVPGVGRYTAGAIASIALGEPAPVVDGNVERVFARLTGFGKGGSVLPRSAWEWAEGSLVRDCPGEWNQALMELGAMVCRPRNPSCACCPLASQCAALREGRVGELPVPPPKPVVVHLTDEMWIPVFEGLYGLRRIPPGRWWAGMYEFPRTLDNVTVLPELVGPGVVTALGSLTHTVTNHRIQVHLSRCECEAPTPALSWYSAEELSVLPMPSAARQAFRRSRI